MSLQSNLTALAQAIGGDIKSLTNKIGTLSSLATTDKSSIVAACNELAAKVGVATEILDSAIAGNTTHTWSADKIISAIAQAKSDIINGAPTALDTLLEISSQMATDETAISGLVTAVGNRVKFDAAQTLDATQKAQAITNIGAISAADVGDVTTDLSAIYTTAKA